MFSDLSDQAALVKIDWTHAGESCTIKIRCWLVGGATAASTVHCPRQTHVSVLCRLIGLNFLIKVVFVMGFRIPIRSYWAFSFNENGKKKIYSPRSLSPSIFQRHIDWHASTFFTLVSYPQPLTNKISKETEKRNKSLDSNPLDVIMSFSQHLFTYFFVSLIFFSFASSQTLPKEEGMYI